MTSRCLLGLLVFGFSASLQSQTTFEQDCARLAALSGNDSQRLQELLKIEWAHRMQDSPEFATEVGYPGLNDRWTDQSLAAIERRRTEVKAPLKAIQSIDRSKLNSEDQLNYDLFNRDKEEANNALRFHDEYFPL